MSTVCESSIMVRLKMYPARNGDAFLLEAAGTHLLIDAGYASTFAQEIAPDLTQLSRAGKHLNLVVSTHIDADHIGGLIEFISLNGPSSSRVIVNVDEVWHNSLRSLPMPVGPQDSEQDRRLLQAIQRRGFRSPSLRASSLNPIGAQQGSSLAKLLKDRGYLWNGGDGTECIATESTLRYLPNGVQIRKIGPSVRRLEELRSWWLKEMRRLSYKASAQLNDLVEDAYEMWCASERQALPTIVTPISGNSARSLSDVYTADTSLTNGSSIATIVSAGGTNILLLGDAWAEDIVAEMKRLRGDTAPMMFGAIKIAHHGSLHNTSVELLSLIDAACYLISSDGSRHGHPDFEVLAEIVDRPAEFERKIYVNYDTPASQRLRAYTSKSGTKFSVQIAGQDWIRIEGAQ